MLEYADLVALNEAIDTTFGRSSIREAGHGVHCTIKSGEKEGEHILEVRFETIVTGHPHGIESMRMQYDDLSIKALNEEIKRIKDDFKSISGKSLTATKGDHRSHMEIISHNPSAVRGKYYNTIQYKVR